MCRLIAGGEPVVTVKGNGLGGRKQEFVLTAAFEISGLPQVVIASDGSTEAVGDVVDGESLLRTRKKFSNVEALLANNDSNNALAGSGDLIITGPTGNNMNDLIVLLIEKSYSKRRKLQPLSMI